MFESDDLYVIVDAAPLVSGHCLIVPKTHVLNIVDIWPKLRLQVYEAKRFIKCQFQKASNSRPIFFEHGTQYPIADADVEHANIHAFPSDGPIVQYFKNEGIIMQPVRGGYHDLQYRKWRGEYYMLSDYDERSYFVSKKRLPSQLLRRILSERHNLHAWNWKDYIEMSAALNTRALIFDSIRLLSAIK